MRGRPTSPPPSGRPRPAERQARPCLHISPCGRLRNPGCNQGAGGRPKAASAALAVSCCCNKPCEPAARAPDPGGANGCAPVRPGPPEARARVGELAHAAQQVPAAQRPAVFGAAADGASFAGLGLAASLADHLEEVGFAAPTAVQRAALPALLAGRDALVAAPTGSGKTLAYLAPLVHDLQARAAPPSVLWALGCWPVREAVTWRGPALAEPACLVACAMDGSAPLSSTGFRGHSVPSASSSAPAFLFCYGG